MAPPSKIRCAHLQKSFADCASGAEADATEQQLGMSTGSTEPEHNSYWFTSDHLGSSAFITDGSGVAIQHLEYMAFGEVFVDQRSTGFGTPYKFNAKELDCESGYYYYSARYYDPRMARFLSVDPLAGEMPEWGSYTYTFNNPLKYIDPTGMGPENPVGDYYDLLGNWLYNDGIDDGKVYEVTNHLPIPSELGGGKYKVEHVGQVDNVKMTFTGNANSDNSKQADGQLNVIQEVSNGKGYKRASYSAVGGPWGNGSPENGDYTVDNLYDRGPRSSWPNDGMTVDGIGFSLNLNPQFKTGRSFLRIHPDGGDYFGTQGCIGLTCGKAALLDFKGLMKSTLSNQNNIPLNINIQNNPNNNGYGGKIRSNGE